MNFPNFISSKKLYMFRTFPLPIIRNFLLYIRQFHPNPAWKLSSNLQKIYKCRMYSRKFLMMGKGNVRNM